MQGEARERWKELCELASTEQDPEKLLELIREVNRLLEEKRLGISGKEAHDGRTAKIASPQPKARKRNRVAPPTLKKPASTPLV